MRRKKPFSVEDEIQIQVENIFVGIELSSEPGRRRPRAQAAKHIHHCRHNFTPRDVAETWPRTAMGRSRCERRAVFFWPPSADHALRSPTAIRRPTAGGWFPGSGVARARGSN